MVKLRSQNSSYQKWLLLGQENHAWFSFFRDPVPYLFTLIVAQTSQDFPCLCAISSAWRAFFFTLDETVFCFWWSPLTLGFPHSSVGKESACNAGDLGLIPGLGRRERLPIPAFWPGEFHGLYGVHGVSKSLMWLSLSHIGLLLLHNKWWQT